MTWQRRLVDLVCAGGAAALVGCAHSPPCGNADPDPCICGHENDDTPQCNAERACEDHGGSWDYVTGETGSDGVVGTCTGSGAPSDAAVHD